jgi:hypothetical protein
MTAVFSSSDGAVAVHGRAATLAGGALGCYALTYAAARETFLLGEILVLEFLGRSKPLARTRAFLPSYG